ncbi:MAG: hypothetical protein H6873_06260 [Hyphomicrobiaceae bacterium]|nr:hypothetical protein [Hyphomicrobiaceae bacterium]
MPAAIMTRENAFVSRPLDNHRVKSAWFPDLVKLFRLHPRPHADRLSNHLRRDIGLEPVREPKPWQTYLR